MANGHPGSCEEATIGSVCHCPCSGVRHSVKLTGGIPAPASAKKGAKGTPTEGYLPKPPPDAAGAPNPTPDVDASAPETGPGPAEQTRSFEQRAIEARVGDEARAAAPASLVDRRGLNNEQAAALEAYFDETYQPINHMLRGGDPSEASRWYTTPDQVAGWIEGIDSAMEGSRLVGEIQTWRGISNGSIIFGDRINGDLTGAEWTEDAYVSTSSEREISKGFAGDDDGAVLMRMIVPPGVGAVELSDGDRSHQENAESEVMLQRGLRMRVVADRGTGEDGMRILDVEVIPA